MTETYTLGNLKRNKMVCDSHPHYSRDSLLRVIDILISKHTFSLDLYELILSQLSIEERTRFIYLLASTSDKPSEIINNLLPKINDASDLESSTKELFDKKPTVLTKEILEKHVRNFYYSSFKGKEVGDSIYDRSERLCSQINCSELDRRVLSVIFLTRMYDPLSRIISFDENINRFYSIMALILSVSINSIKNCLSETSPLLVSETLERDYLPPPHFLMHEKIYNYFENPEASFPVYKPIRQSTESTFNLETFSIPMNDKELCTNILSSQSSSSLLIYGIPGTGKTEFAKTISHNTGNPVYFLNVLLKPGRDMNISRRYAMLTSVELLESINGILIIDEADSILNSERLESNESEKGWLVDFLDNLKIKTIWISNDISNVHPAVLRRFTSSIAFSQFNKNDRKNLWENRLTGTSLGNIINKETIQNLSQTYDVNAGGIAKVINSVSNLSNFSELKETQILNLMKTMLDQHQTLLGGAFSKKLKPISTSYDPFILNADTDLKQIETAIRQYDKEKYQQPLNILFWGLPGTGKTEYVKYLAEKSGKTLLLKRPSDFLSKYIGETENKIAEAFIEAEEKEAILFLDEADSFFISRDKMERNFEKTQTNELLTQMENFTGVLICSTNHLSYLDTAVMRRFSWKVELKPLRTKDRISLFKNIFNISDAETLEGLNDLKDLTPGDMYAVHSRLKFTDISENTEVIIEELKKECLYKDGVQKRVIGF